MKHQHFVVWVIYKTRSVYLDMMSFLEKNLGKNSRERTRQNMAENFLTENRCDFVKIRWFLRGFEIRLIASKWIKNIRSSIELLIFFCFNRNEKPRKSTIYRASLSIKSLKISQKWYIHLLTDYFLYYFWNHSLAFLSFKPFLQTHMQIILMW